MPQIIVSPEELFSVAVRFKTKKAELDALTNQANATTQNLLSAWQGMRAGRFSGEWESMRINLQNAARTLDQASELLQRAAADFRAADSP